MTGLPYIDVPPYHHVHLSSKWANDVTGTHDLRYYDDPHAAHPNGTTSPLPPFYDHVHYLLPLIFAYDAIMQLGWAEHTSDWDWRVGIQTRDGVWHGDYTFTDPDNDEPDEDHIEDGLEMFLPGEDGAPLTYDNMPFGFELDYGTIIIALGSGRESFPLRDIAIITIDQR